MLKSIWKETILTVEERSVFLGNPWEEWKDTEIKLKSWYDTSYR